MSAAIDDSCKAATDLSYLAGLYPALHFGTMVVSHSFRNPALLAKMAATLHYLTDGRPILGIGAGWNEEEYRAYGYDFPPRGQRVLGHPSIATMGHYLTPSKDDLRKAIGRAEV
jgi:luciferase-like monooxygenase